MASFAGQGLFDSGPSSVRYGRTGRFFQSPFASGDFVSPNVVDLAPRELEVIQAGRLVASNTFQLWGLIEAVRSIAVATTRGTLVTDGGQAISGLTLLRFEPGEFEVGSRWSCSYECLYIRSAL